MPGLNGKQLSQALKKNPPHLPVLFMSGYAQDVIASENVWEEGSRLIPKPFFIPEFLNTGHALPPPSQEAPQVKAERRGDA